MPLAVSIPRSPARFAASFLRHHRELAFQQYDDIRRRHLNQVGPLWITAIDEERRLALKVGGARLLEYVVSSYKDLDRTGHWRS